MSNMNKRLKKKKSFEDYLGRSNAWNRVITTDRGIFEYYSIFRVWNVDDVVTWRGYLYRNFRPENSENDVKYRRATMFHYIDKKVRKQYKKLQYAIAVLESHRHQALLSAKHIIGVSDSCEGMYLDD